MNTGISKPINTATRRGLLPIAAFALSGCLGGGEGLSFAPTNTDTTTSSPTVPHSQKTALARGGVTVKAPNGYCIDDTSVRNGLVNSSALIATCTSLKGKGSGLDSAVMTVNVSARRPSESQAPDADTLAQAIGPDRALSRSQKGTLALVNVKDGGDDMFAPADARHWRGATTLDTRLVLLGLYAPEGSALAGSGGSALMVKLAKGISATKGSFLGRALSQDQNTQEPSTQPDSSAQTETAVEEAGGKEIPKKGVRGLIGRLFKQS